MFEWNQLLENVHMQRAVVIFISIAILFVVGKTVKFSISFILKKVVLLVAMTLLLLGATTYVMGVI